MVGLLPDATRAGRLGFVEEGEAIAAGTYRLTFHVGEYFAAAGSPDACRFLREVPVVFGIDDPTGSYHVPLVVSPWSYSTYRGS